MSGKYDVRKVLLLLLAVVLVGAGVAITYHLFENAVHITIDLIWYDLFNTDKVRWMVAPLAVGISLLYFGLQHRLDPYSEKVEEKGLGEMPTPNIANFLKALGIGFVSLVAGAALGPEAILVPAAMLLGALIARKLLGGGQTQLQLLVAAGLMALFAAFFHSFIVGVLSLALVLFESKAPFKPVLLLVAVIASGASKLTLDAIGGGSYLELPAYSWNVNGTTLGLCVALVAAGYLAVVLMGTLIRQLDKHFARLRSASWVVRGLVAGVVLAGLYLLGGPLVEFTGNKSIEPMLQQASELGMAGLVWVALIKIVVICWSKAAGYRGGMIFPTVFVAAVFVAIVQLYVTDFNLAYGLIAVLAGALAANTRSRVLA